jgi:hypothetical protein
VERVLVLLETPPTTVDGFAAMFDYLAETNNEFGTSNMEAAIGYWSGLPGQTDRPRPEEWLEMLATAMRKLQGEAQA